MKLLFDKTGERRLLHLGDRIIKRIFHSGLFFEWKSRPDIRLDRSGFTQPSRYPKDLWSPGRVQLKGQGIWNACHNSLWNNRYKIRCIWGNHPFLLPFLEFFASKLWNCVGIFNGKEGSDMSSPEALRNCPGKRFNFLHETRQNNNQSIQGSIYPLGIQYKIQVIKTETIITKKCRFIIINYYYCIINY